MAKISGEHSKKRGRVGKARAAMGFEDRLLRRKEGALSQIMNADNFMLCLAAFVFIMVCLAGYGVVLASQMQLNAPRKIDIDKFPGPNRLEKPEFRLADESYGRL